ncbi:MAG: 4-(cytidine 5'-diphospho)-2-C-methyl-D-erythritol kinase [Planctomycetaceae bacterium]
MSERIVERAHAKLNVFLRVLGRRDDGFHDVETLLLPLEVHDLVTVEPADAFAVEVTGPRAEELARAGGESLVARAAAAVARATGLPAPPAVRVTIDKRVAVAAGMGGGSADAAAVLRALGRLLGAGRDDLVTIAAEVGSDVPALVHGGPVFAEGRGERVTPVHAVTSHWVVAPLPFPVSAADAYAWWDAHPRTGPDPGALIAALETGNDELLGSALYDDLAPGVLAHHPEVAATIEAFEGAGALGAVMTGSGPTVVALARHLGQADALAAGVPGAFATSGPPVERLVGP